MTEKDAFANRERALEDEFFHRTDKALMAKMRQSLQREESREALAMATGIQDAALLDTLLDRGVQATSLLALALVPAVFVAWADGDVTAEEREAILKSAHGNGIPDGSLAAQLLSEWLLVRPAPALWETWQHYVRTVHGSLDAASQQSLSNTILNQARAVAKASGGVLGIGKISGDEQRVLDDTERTLTS